MIAGRLSAVSAIVIISSMATIASLSDVYPNPQTDVYHCGQGGRVSWICDPDNVLSYTQAEEMNAALLRLRDDTNCSCSNPGLCSNHSRHGYSVAVALMSFIPSTRSQVITVKSYANYLRQNEWLYGNCQDDVVIVFSKLEKEVAASIGDTAALKLTERIMADVYEDTKDFFQNEDFFEGLLDIIDRMKTAFKSEYVITPSFPVWTVVQMAMAALFVSICFFSMYICKRIYS